MSKILQCAALSSVYKLVEANNGALKSYLLYCHESRRKDHFHGGIYHNWISKSDRFFASQGADDKLVKVWRALEGTLVRTFRGHKVASAGLGESPKSSSNRQK